MSTPDAHWHICVHCRRLFWHRRSVVKHWSTMVAAHRCDQCGGKLEISSSCLITMLSKFDLLDGFGFPDFSRFTHVVGYYP